jgi:uncharacterized membrane protein
MSRSTRSRRAAPTAALLYGALALVAGGCGGSEPVAPAPVLTVLTTPATLAVLPGAAGQATVTVSRSAPSAGTVNLDATGLPPGVAVAFAPTALAANQTTSTLTFTVAAGTAAGQFPITVRATSASATAGSATIPLAVLPPATVGLSATVPTAAIAGLAAAAGTSSLITLTRSTGFTAPVDLTVENSPAGWTVTVAPTTVPNGVTAASVSISVPARTAAGSYSVTVRGRATGAPDATVVITQTVN